MDLGKAALILAVAIIASDRAVALLSRWIPLLQAPSMPGQLYWWALTQTALMLIALGLGIAAAVTRRGRSYGLAAVVLAVLGSELAPTLVYDVLIPRIR